MAGCFFCERLAHASAIPGGAIFEDELLHASHWFDGGPEYLGHLVLQTKRHAPGVADLTDEEARRVGLVATRLARALKATVGAEKVYAYVFAEAVPHYHQLLTARYPGVPKEYWRLNLGEWPDAPRGDANAVAEVARRVRSYLETAEA